MPAETHIETNLAMKLERAERWQEPLVLLRERLHAGGVAETRQLEGRDKNDKMIKMMVLMSTGEGQSTHCRAAPQHADPFRIRRSPAGVVEHLLPRHLVVRHRDLGDLEKTPTTTSLAPGLRPLHLRTAKTTQQAVAGEKRTA